MLHSYPKRALARVVDSREAGVLHAASEVPVMGFVVVLRRSIIVMW